MTSISVEGNGATGKCRGKVLIRLEKVQSLSIVTLAPSGYREPHGTHRELCIQEPNSQTHWWTWELLACPQGLPSRDVCHCRSGAPSGAYQEFFPSFYRIAQSDHWSCDAHPKVPLPQKVLQHSRAAQNQVLWLHLPSCLNQTCELWRFLEHPKLLLTISFTDLHHIFLMDFYFLLQNLFSAKNKWSIFPSNECHFHLSRVYLLCFTVLANDPQWYKVN